MGSRGREIGYGMAYGPSEIGEEYEVGVGPLFSDNYPFKQRYSSSMFLHGRKTYQSIVDFFKGMKMISQLKRGRNVPSSFSVTLCAVVCVVSVLFKGVEAFSPLWDSVKTQVFQEYEIISTRGQISIVRSRLNDVKKHELIVGENVKQNSRLILTCTAWYPSEWVYSGDADPTYTSNTTIENLGAQGQVLPLDDVNGAKRYVATIVIGPRGIKQADTGRYNCMTASPETGMKYKTLSAFYHLFVPGKTLFIRKRGGTILYDLRKSPARIPCGVTNPRVAVSLQKFQNGHLINVDNETMLYHPISGFYPRHDIPGTYVCTAGHNKAFELLHFTLVPKLTDITALQGLRQSSEEDLEWLFNSFKLGHPNRIHLSTRPPATYGSGERKKPKPTTHRPPQKQQQLQQSDERPTSIWKRPSEEDNNDVLVSGNTGPSTYRPVYVLFAEDLNRLKAKPQTQRPTSSSSGSGSASGSGSDETEEEEEREGENQEAEAEESQSHEVDEREPDHQFHFDAQNQKNAPILLHQLYTTQRPSQVPTTPVSLRPSLHREYATTYLPFLNFLNPESAVIKYKPVVNPSESIIREYDDASRRTTTKRPFTGQIVYDVQSNRLVYQEHVQQPNHHQQQGHRQQQNQHQQHGHRQQQNQHQQQHGHRQQQNQHQQQHGHRQQQNQHQQHGQNGHINQHAYSGFTRPTTEKPSRATSKPTNRFRIPSLPTQRWPTTKKTRATTRGTTTSTTPAPPLIPDAVVCINSPCGKHATCFANTVYYHKQKETRREPACKCVDGYHGNPYLECRPPNEEETDFLSFNNTGLFEKRRGSPESVSEELEEGHLKNSEVFRSNREDVIVDLKK